MYKKIILKLYKFFRPISLEKLTTSERYAIMILLNISRNPDTVRIAFFKQDCCCVVSESSDIIIIYDSILNRVTIRDKESNYEQSIILKKRANSCFQDILYSIKSFENKLSDQTTNTLKTLYNNILK